jgi:hypothetical protein
MEDPRDNLEAVTFHDVWTADSDILGEGKMRIPNE